jgi:hypothetical protein
MESHLFMSIIVVRSSTRPFVVFRTKEWPSHAILAHWDGSNQCMASKPKNNDCCPRRGTSF